MDKTILIEIPVLEKTITEIVKDKKFVIEESSNSFIIRVTHKLSGGSTSDDIVPLKIVIKDNKKYCSESDYKTFVNLIKGTNYKL